jgi:hypothetical protein
VNLRGRIRRKERELELAQRALRQNSEEFRRVLQAKLSSRTALVAGFAGGLLFGWSQGRRRRARRVRPAGARAGAARAGEESGLRRARRRVTEGMPPHWLRSYIVWPFLLASARDVLVERRPTRGQA